MMRASNRKKKQTSKRQIIKQFSRVRLTSRTSNIPISVGDGAAGRVADSFQTDFKMTGGSVLICLFLVKQIKTELLKKTEN